LRPFLTPIRLRIYRLAAGLKRAHKLDGKIIEPDRLHISLFFLGGSPNPIARMHLPVITRFCLVMH
jgi:hypothetical protein